MSSGFLNLLNAKAEEIQQKNHLQRIQYNFQMQLFDFAWLIMEALQDVPGVIAPCDVSELYTTNSIPGNMVFRVVIARGAGANPNVITNVKTAIYNTISRRFNLSLPNVRKSYRVDVVGENILIKY